MESWTSVWIQLRDSWQSWTGALEEVSGLVARDGFGKGSVRFCFPRGRAILEQDCTHLVDETGKLRVEGLDLLLLLAAYLVFQRVHSDAEGLQQPLVDADPLDAVGLALRVPAHDAVSAGAAQANPASCSVPIAHASEAHLPKAGGAAAPVDIGDPPAAAQVANAPATVGATAHRLAGRCCVAAAADLRGWTEASSSQDRSHRWCLPAHCGLFEGRIAKLWGCSGAG